MSNHKYNEVYINAGLNDLIYNVDNPFKTIGPVATVSTEHTAWPGASTSIKGNYLYPHSSTADITYIVSTSASDTRWAVLDGIDNNGYRVIQLVQLNGQTPVALSTPLLAINQQRYLGTTKNVGIIYTMVGNSVTSGVPDNDSDVKGIILAGEMISQQCVYTVPINGSIALADGFGQLFTTTGVSTTAEIVWGGTAIGPDGRTDFVWFGDLEISNSHYRHDLNYVNPLTLPGLSTVEMRITDLSAVSVTIRGLFTGRVVLR